MRICFLGTGASEGIPAMGCHCQHCLRARREDGRLVRRRNAVLFSLPEYNLLLDTPPDIRELLEANAVENISGIFLTHEHYDHTAGLEEFLYWPQNLDLFTDPRVYRRLIRQSWGERLPEIAFYLPVRPGMPIEFHRFTLIPFEVRHGVPCLALALFEEGRRVIHLADSDRRLSNYALNLIQGADLLIVNTPFFESRDDEAHLSVEDAIALQQQTGVQHLVLSHFNHHNRPHDELEAYAAQFSDVTMAYDGLMLEV